MNKGEYFSLSAVLLREEVELTEGVEYSDAGPGLVSTSPQFSSRSDKNVASSKSVKREKPLIFK